MERLNAIILRIYIYIYIYIYRLKYRLKLSQNIKTQDLKCNKKVHLEVYYTYSDKDTGSFRTSIKLSFLIKL